MDSTNMDLVIRCFSFRFQIKSIFLSDGIRWHIIAFTAKGGLNFTWDIVVDDHTGGARRFSIYSLIMERNFAA
ncbi:hypothetical protein D3C86_2075530 [compost metagenome]